MVVWIQNPFDNLPGEGYRRQRYWMMADAFVRFGHHVVYWTSDFSHATKRTRREVAGDSGADGIEVRLIPTIPYRKNISLRRVSSHCAYARKWLELASTPVQQPSLIITSCPTLSAADSALELGRRFGAKVVVDVQDAWPETFERLAPRGFGWLAKAILYPLNRQARRIYREANLVSGVCDRYRELTGRADFYRAYLGIELESGVSAADGASNRRIRMVYSGNMGRTYDLDTVVEAVAANEDFELDIAGFGGELSCPPSARDRVRFHGMLPAADLRRLFAECDVGVIPMSDASWVGIPNKMFDYSAAGLSVVSSLGGETAALLERYGCGAIYRAGDRDALSSAVRIAADLPRSASRRLCEAEFDAVKIYNEYVKWVCHD